MKYQITVILSLLLFSNTIFSQEAAQWRGKDRDGIYNETGLLRSWPAEGPALLWHFDNIGDGHSSAAVVSHDRIFTSGAIGGKGQVFAFTLDGKLIWS
ncbi:MAG: polyvinylalcohol dehydrogenase, partial [Bacteroidota bacterium]